MFDFSRVKKIHFMGVGGVSMSSLARYFHSSGYIVTGSDREYSDTLQALSSEGIDVWVGFDPVKVGRPDLAVYTSAIKQSDVELSYLRSSGIYVLERFAFLPYLCSLFKEVVAISGTHGKTTVTSMCAEIMKASSLKFYAHIGGASRNLGPFFYSGNDYLLIEACEYRKSFLGINSSLSVVLNVEPDHPDTYSSKTELFDAFDDFLSNCHGLKIINGDSDYYALRRKNSSYLTFGFSLSSDFRATDLKCDKFGCFGFNILRFGIPYCSVKLNIPGKHNVFNALCAVAVCDSIGIKKDVTEKALNGFCGVERRFEKRGILNGAAVYCDYAHHPTEIRSAIETARSVSKNNLTVVFQPHTFSRTVSYKDDFVASLALCDKLIIVKEYSARERPENGMSAAALFRECTNADKYYADTLLDACVYLVKKTTQNDFVLVLGAGDVVRLCDILPLTFTV